MQFQNDMRALWSIVIVGLRMLGFAFPNRAANPVVHTPSGLAKPMFCLHRTRGDPCGPHSLWVFESSSLWSTRSLGWRARTAAFPNRAGNPMVHSHSWWAKPEFGLHEMRTLMVHGRSGRAKPAVVRSQNGKRSLLSTLMLGRRNLRCSLPGRKANLMVTPILG